MSDLEPLPAILALAADCAATLEERIDLFDPAFFEYKSEPQQAREKFN